jgi:hypothetical protein
MGAAGHGMALHYGEQQHYGGPPVGMDPSRSNVLLVYIDDVEYTPTLDALHTVFKTYGHVQKMTIFEKGGHWQVRLQALATLRTGFVVAQWLWLQIAAESGSPSRLHAFCWLMHLPHVYIPIQRYCCCLCACLSRVLADLVVTVMRIVLACACRPLCSIQMRAQQIRRKST